MIEITMLNARKHFGNTLVLWDCSFRVFQNEKIGIVGDNGTGKTTILKLLAGKILMDIDYRQISEGKSRISIPKGTTIAYLEQEATFPVNTRVEEVLSLAFSNLYKIEKKLQELEKDMENMSNIHLNSILNLYSKKQLEFETKGGYGIHERFCKVCTGLKIDNEFLKKDFNVLSGGEKTIVMLAKVLLENANVLLLDEPTNHLDMDSLEWLEQFIKKYSGIVIMVSHDRFFLDKVVSKTIEIENHKATTYSGNYSSYIKQKDDDILIQFKQHNNQQKKINNMGKSIKELREWAMKSDNNKFYRRASSIQKRLNMMVEINNPIKKQHKVKLNIKHSGRDPHKILNVTGLYKSFNEKGIFENANFILNGGDCVALIGANGSGKTTLIKMILNQNSIDKGEIVYGEKIKIAYLPQLISFKDENQRVIECFRDDKEILLGDAREYLSKYLFFGNTVFKKVNQLSGGERVRLKLSMLLYEKIDFLILDEPTNHLDICSREILEEAIANFNGTLLLISHDRYFIDNICTKIFAIECSKINTFLGNYTAYRETLKSK